MAEIVWSRFGQVRNYCEPFFGSGAMLLNRPMPFEGTETVNDINGWLCNFWRALQADPDEVARYADWPVSELDLHARGDWLFYRDGVDLWIEQLRSDPDFYDAKSAGWWVWGQCCWIGTGWGPMMRAQKKERQLPHLGDAGRGVNRQLPHLGDAGRGVNRQRPHLGDAGVNRQRPHLGDAGVNRKRPHLGNMGRGVNRQRPHLGDAGRGDEPPTSKGESLRAYLRELAERLRGVRICCGDWSRICGPTPTVKQGITAVFLDPPYGVDDRADCYDSYEDREISKAVRDWCLEWQDEPRMRIALCGYDGEHEMPESWECFEWKARGGYGSQAVNGNDNPARERIWFSPHCLTEAQTPLFRIGAS